MQILSVRIFTILPVVMSYFSAPLKMYGLFGLSNCPALARQCAPTRVTVAVPVAVICPTDAVALAPVSRMATPGVTCISPADMTAAAPVSVTAASASLTCSQWTLTTASFASRTCSQWTLTTFPAEVPAAEIVPALEVALAPVSVTAASPTAPIVPALAVAEAPVIVTEPLTAALCCHTAFHTGFHMSFQLMPMEATDYTPNSFGFVPVPVMVTSLIFCMFASTMPVVTAIVMSAKLAGNDCVNV
jgi:hypothetical protein